MNGLTQTERDTLFALISKSSNEDLQALIPVFKARQSTLATMKTAQFRVGQKVEFDGKYGELVTGTITKVNRKTIKVRATEGVLWTVSPGLLREVA